MNESNKPIDKLLHDLKERAKELTCLYEIQELLSTPDITIQEICQGIIRAIPPGWQYPDVCLARMIYGGSIYQSPNFVETPWAQRSNIVVQDEIVGQIQVYYSEERPASDEGPFLKEERKLIDTIAEQFGHFILHHQLKQVFEKQLISEKDRKAEWWVILNMLKRTDPPLLKRITRKMINYLYWNDVKEAERLLELFSPAYGAERALQDDNRPYQIETGIDSLALSEAVFDLASKHVPESTILDNIQLWIKEDQSGFLINVLVNPGSSLADINVAIERYHHLVDQGLELSMPRETSVRVSLIRRILYEQSQFIEIAKRYIEVDEYFELIHHMIYPTNSHGKLGGKSSGLFLAKQILKKTSQQEDHLRKVKTPKTWYISSDCVFYFISYNNIEDVIEQKYKDIDRVRQEYPYIIQMFKNSQLPPEITKDLSLALDDFGDVPLIVRSSSLLEDRRGMAFAGKYKSLFIANQGSKEERLNALMDAITEVYASTFGPDPIRYRAEHGLIDDHEEMGIMIQEVVGTEVGHYFFPALSGVAFSNNEFRWSSRIRREDGLIRLVPGLGTRAVDRLSDDYPILIAPGQPGLRVNVTLDEIIRYSPKKMDVINLKTGSFETVDIQSLLVKFGREYPGIHQIISIIEDDRVKKPNPLGVDFENEDFVITFDGLVTRTPFIQQILAILNELQDKLSYPVDIEFAYDGADFYLLQCRSQSHLEYSQPALIPVNIPRDQIIFSANRYVSNASLFNITHLVYVNPQKYSELSSHQELLEVGRAVGRLNHVLPKRGFILMGPGRWGSRGDIRLGVSVTYSDINNTSMLIEIARAQKDYSPEPSFGTHFFQDLVEAGIRYLPLYPDDAGIIFNEEFLTSSQNILSDILPEFAHFKDVLKVIDISQATEGQVLQIRMNADQGKALAFLTEQSNQGSEGIST